MALTRVSITAEALAPKPIYGTREQWLEAGTEMVASVFEAAGLELPPVKVSCSWPGGGSARKRVGECWSRNSSSSGINEIFISPLIAKPVVALDILVHELVHAYDDCQNGHKAAFIRIARQVGLEGKPTSCHAGPELLATLEIIAAELGTYPHTGMRLRAPKSPVQGDIRCKCNSCALVFRAAKKWADAGLVCPACGDDLDIR
jgi:hypothetical protein